MLYSFKDEETALIFEGVRIKSLPLEVQNIARRKLRMMDNAQSLQDLRVPPGNRLEFLGGDREGQYSVRINDKYRICFRWDNGKCLDVEIVDYH